MDVLFWGFTIATVVLMLYSFAKFVYHTHQMRKNLDLLGKQLKEIENFIEEQL